MARTNNLTNFLTDVSSAIKQKTGDNTPIPASDFDTEILSIETGGNYQSKTLEVRQNGNYNLLPDTGYDAISDVSISVSVSPILQNKTITENGSYTADQNYDGLGTVIVNVQGGTINNQDKTITQNGQYTADSGYTGLGTVTVNVSSGSGDVKLFDTVEHMQADPDASEGDLAVVYREELTGVTEESEFDSCTFPDEVILDEAFTGNVYGRFRSTGSGWFDGNVDMSSSGFRFRGYGESSEISVRYTSQDGITYTRTDGGEELQEFGTTIKWESWGDPFNSIIGNFMKIGGNYFEGLYEYGPFVRNIVAFNTENIDVTTSPYITVTNTNIKVKVDTLDKCCNAARRYLCGGDNYIFQGDFYLTSDLQNIIYVGNYSLTYSDRYVSIQQLFMNITNNKIYLPVSSNRSDLRDTDNKILNYNIENETITELTLQGDTTFVDANNNSYSCKEFNGYFLAANSYRLYTIDWITDNANVYNYLNWENNNSKKVQLKEINTSIYAPAKTQLDATSDYVYEKTFYGKNGVENGILTTNVSNSFADVNAEVYVKLQQQYDNMQPRVLTDQDKTIDKNIRIIPSRSDGTPLLDTSSVTNMEIMFGNCTNLTTIPQLNTSSVTNMSSMFMSCTNLTTIPELNTSNVTNMASMFMSCTSLTTVPQLNTSSVTYMRSIFMGCTSLTTIPLIDTSNVTNMNNMFMRCTSLTTVPQLNTSSVTEMGSMFENCTSLTTIPLIDTSSVTYMRSMFYNCSSLTTVPQLNTSSVTGMYSMFDNCSALSNDSLNNILAMCTNATKITSNKTLKDIGLSQEQATICTTLSNYSAFIAAGWTTGY